jgi:hypothetical protein
MLEGESPACNQIKNIFRPTGDANVILMCDHSVGSQKRECPTQLVSNTLPITPPTLHCRPCTWPCQSHHLSNCVGPPGVKKINGVISPTASPHPPCGMCHDNHNKKNMKENDPSQSRCIDTSMHVFQRMSSKEEN